ncbi:MAG: YiiX/YebB-like N1pC/P60 family cysteine hydrolase [Planctomycetota bacterium]
MRLCLLGGILALLFALFILPAGISYLGYAPQEGDVVFQSLPHADLVDAIEGVTGSPYSHCGVVVREEGRWLVVEAIGEVQKTPLWKWIFRGRGGRLAAFRLKPEYRQDIPRFVGELNPFLGRPYDFSYSMDDEFLYCSELVYKAYRNATGQELGTLKRLGEMNWKPYEETIRRYEEGPTPLDRLMITPRHLSDSERLEKVFGGDF